MEPTIVDGFQSMQIRWSKLSKSETPKSHLNSTSIARSRVVRRQQHETHYALISMDSKVGQRSSPIRLQIQKPSRTAGHERSDTSRSVARTHSWPLLLTDLLNPICPIV
ncbi:hypothetical protein ACLOJK_004061 [Asimina triloba]